MHNPFIERKDESESDGQLLEEALAGDAGALERLVYRHQAWIYNIVLRMVLDPHDAEDATQEILVKIITRLSGYDAAKGALRTWIYRIAANHVLNMKRGLPEALMLDGARLRDEFRPSIEDYADTRAGSRPDSALLAEETRERCLAGLLLCLERRQRLVFILGCVFGVPAKTGAEIAGVSAVNYRAMLSRARARLANFLESRCSLIDPSNPCRCSRQVANMIRVKWLDPQGVRHGAGGGIIVAEAIGSGARRKRLMGALRLYRESPFIEGPDMASRVREIIAREEVQELMRFH
jgi:RNA polymerase sigma factor (sigma-70 family)